MDIIFLRGLHIETIIGIHEWERNTRQAVEIDLEMAFDIRKAAASDAIEDTLDYDAVSKRVIAFVEESRFQLIEALAETVAGLVLSEFKLPWLRLTLHKRGAVKAASDVGIVIERGEKPAHG